jgi:hypothetical protein
MLEDAEPDILAFYAYPRRALAQAPQHQPARALQPRGRPAHRRRRHFPRTRRSHNTEIKEEVASSKRPEPPTSSPTSAAPHFYTTSWDLTRRPPAPGHRARRRRSDVPRAARGFERAGARRRALRTFVLTALGRVGTGVASARSAAGGAGCSLLVALRRLERLEPRSQIGNFPAQLGDLATLVDEFGGEASQREAESLSAKLGAQARQVRLVIRGHAAVSRDRARARIARPRASRRRDAPAGSRGCEPSRCIRCSGGMSQTA